MTKKNVPFQVRVSCLNDLGSSRGEFPILTIPHYQRGFTWGKEQVVTLLVDINEAYADGSRGYFIGPITVSEDDPDIPNQVIDGQQRLTTLGIIVKVLSDALLQSDSVSLRQRACHHLIFNDRSKSPFIKHLRNEDSRAYINIMSDDAPPQKSTSLADALKNITNYFQDFSENDKAEYLEFLVNDVTFIQVDCGDDELSYQIFETLNDRGKGLQPLDLIRNRLFSTLNGKHLDAAVESWSRLQQIFSFKTSSKNPDNHIQELFSIFLMLEKKSWLEPKKLFPALKQSIKEAKKPDRYSANLIKRVTDDESMDAFFKATSAGEAGNADSRRLRKCISEFRDFKILRPLSFSLFLRQFENEICADVILMAGFLVKRTQVLGKIPIQSYGQLFVELATEINHGAVSDVDVTEYVRDKLLAHDETERKVLDDELFIERLAAQPIIKEEKAKEIFINLYNHKSEGDLTLIASSDLHLEHILPQEHHAENWPEFSEEEHKNSYQRLGNMMILSDKRNQQAARKPFKEKREGYYQATTGNDFAKVSYLDDYVETWGPNQIIERQRQIAADLSEVWKV